MKDLQNLPAPFRVKKVQLGDPDTILEDVTVTFLELEHPIYGESNLEDIGISNETLIKDYPVLIAFQFLAFVVIPKHSLSLLEVVTNKGYPLPKRLCLLDIQEIVTLDEALSRVNMVLFEPELN